MTTLAYPTQLDKATTANSTITKSELFRAYNHLRAIVKTWGDQKAMDRLNKALGILQSKAYYTGDRMAYTPTVTGCGCKDWEFRNAKRRGTLAPCKHIFAEMLFQAIMQERAAFDVTEEMHEARHALTSSYNF